MALSCGLTSVRGTEVKITKMNPSSPRKYKEKKISTGETGSLMRGF
jgi:surface antigen